MFGLSKKKKRDLYQAAFDCELDFNAMRAFSIEREEDEDGDRVTIIGYLSAKGGEDSWYLSNISDAKHQELVEQFRQSRPGVVPRNPLAGITTCELSQ